MKKFSFLLIGSLFCIYSSAQLGNLNKAIKKNSDALNKVKNGVSGNGASLSSDDIIAGLKEALATGTSNTTKILNNPDGYFGNAAIKILMPEDAKKVEATLRKMGMSSIVDNAILSMNRAAEDAAGGVTEIFITAIKKMTVKDGLTILNGGDFAATNYLKQTTTEELTNSMRPVINASLEKVNATNAWDKVFSTYNKVSLKKVETDLSAYVTTRALEGMFHTISLEEQKIRKDPAARTSEILQKVFSK